MGLARRTNCREAGRSKRRETRDTGNRSKAVHVQRKTYKVQRRKNNEQDVCRGGVRDPPG